MEKPMPYNVYKLIHFLGIFTVMVVIAVACMHVLRGGTRADNPQRKLLGIAHGIAMFFILLGGFGMLARLDVMHSSLPAWVYGKLAIWMLVAAAPALLYRGPRFAKATMLAAPALAVLAAAIALYKPF
jgi:hypothetical protein